MEEVERESEHIISNAPKRRFSGCRLVPPGSAQNAMQLAQAKVSTKSQFLLQQFLSCPLPPSQCFNKVSFNS